MPIIALWTGSEPGARYVWRNLQLIEDGRVTIIDLRQALLAGWNYDRFSVQDGDAWGDMPAESIVAWKRSAHGDSTYHDLDADAAARSIAWLREQGWSPRVRP